MGKKGFTPKYKKEIIKLVTEYRKKITEVAKDLGATPTSIDRVNNIVNMKRMLS